MSRCVFNFIQFLKRSNSVRFSQSINNGSRLQNNYTYDKFTKKYFFYTCLSSSVLGLVFYLNSKQKILCHEQLIEENIKNTRYDIAISKSRDIIQKFKDELGIPGVVVGVSIDGNTVWQEGFGYSDIENRLKCSPDTVMRIGSISKSITMTAVAKLWEENKLDLDKPVQYYVPDFPVKKFKGEKVQITCRQLLSHLSGIRHYKKNDESSNTKDGTKKNEFEYNEYYMREKYHDINSALKIFQNDELLNKPGSKFNYSTHAWTLVSAIVEKASNETFTDHITKLFKDLGLTHTYLDVNDALIYHRSRFYRKNKKGNIENAPYVDNSYKWAGGGLLSTVGDILLFGNAMLYSLQFQPEIESHNKITNDLSSNPLIYNVPQIDSDYLKEENSKILRHKRLPGYLKRNTIKTMWTPITETTSKDYMYGMGWFVLPEKHICEYCRMQPFAAGHSGGSIGASCMMLVFPKMCNNKNTIECNWSNPPKGIIVVILTNLQDTIGLSKNVNAIFEIFKEYSD